MYTVFKGLNILNIMDLINSNTTITLVNTAKPTSKFILKLSKENYICIYLNALIAKVTTKLIYIHVHSGVITLTKNRILKSIRSFVKIKTD